MANAATNEFENLQLESRPRGGGNRRGGRGGGGGMSRETQVSKALSKLLRHQAENAGIQLDGEGYAPLDAVVGFPSI